MSCHFAPVSAGHEDVVKELVGAGADVNKRNEKGLTPLYAFLHPYFILCATATTDPNRPFPRHYAASKSRIDVGNSPIFSPSSAME